MVLEGDSEEGIFDEEFIEVEEPMPVVREPTEFHYDDTYFTSEKYSNELKKNLSLPEYCCIVCCKLLFQNDVNLMDADEELVLNAHLIKRGMKWPVTYYRDKNGMPISWKRYNKKHSDGYFRKVLCPSHKSSGYNNNEIRLQSMLFYNTHWQFPGIIPDELQGLKMKYEGLLCPIMVFCELSNSKTVGNRATRAGYHFANGRIGIFKSKEYIGEYAGTRGLIYNEGDKGRMTEEERLRVSNAHEWICSNNPLFKDHYRNGKSLSQNPVNNVHENIHLRRTRNHNDQNNSNFKSELLMPVDDGGPRTADEENIFKNLVIGVDDHNQYVRYSNPRLMGYLFPTLYVNGKGFFSLDYDGIPKSSSSSIETVGGARIQSASDVASASTKSQDITVHDVTSSSGGETNSRNKEKNSSHQYSRTTLKCYAKFRLMSVDRRFATSIKYIFMLFDWCQKQVVFGYHNRRAPRKMGGRKTTVKDVLEGSNSGGLRYNQHCTVSIPPTLRTGVKYKQELYFKFSALFDRFNTPQLFGTFTCDDQSPGQKNVAAYLHGNGTPTHKDPVLFLMHWKAQWSRFFTFLRKDWAEKRAGGTIAFCWVLEVQERGTPHTHFCLWTGKTIQQLIEDNVITCSSYGATDDVTSLIQKHQVHKCSRYCQSEYQDGCRFGFPKEVHLENTTFDQVTNRFIYRRQKQDEFINSYNTELLQFGRVNMELQYNYGSAAKRYMCKYITKQASIHQGIFSQDRENSTNEPRHVVSDAYVQHFQYRSISLTEAIFELCSWDMSGMSHSVVFLPTDMPGNDQPILKRSRDLRGIFIEQQKTQWMDSTDDEDISDDDIEDITKENNQFKEVGTVNEYGDCDNQGLEDKDIFLKDKWQKYLERPRNQEGRFDFEEICYKNYYEQFSYYQASKTVSRNYKDDSPKKRMVVARQTPAIIRTKPLSITNTEDAFRQLLMLYHPTRVDVDKWLNTKEEPIYKTFQEMAVAKLGLDRIIKYSPGLSVVIQHGIIPYDKQNEDEFHIERHNFKLTDDQNEVYQVAIELLNRKPVETLQQRQLLVTGAAGTGKSTLLNRISQYAAKNMYKVIRLAPSGVAAVNIKGQTIHRWFRIARASKGYKFIANSYAVRSQLIDIAVKGLTPLFLIDEVSMIPGALLTEIEETLSKALYSKGEAFGGAAVIFFGDFGQLSPVCRGQKSVDWFWRSPTYKTLEKNRYDVTSSCRQQNDDEFKEFLDCVRKGKLSEKATEVFIYILKNSARYRGSFPIGTIHLLTHRKDVMDFNLRCLDQLPGKIWYSFSEDDGGVIYDEGILETISSETGLETILALKLGAYVMCTSNIDFEGGLINGTLGNIVGLYEGFVDIEIEGGRKFRVGKEYRATGQGNHERYQIPIVLSWAMTIHKSQSLTLPKVVVSLKKVFSSGQPYVALSRVRSKDDIFIKDCDLTKMFKVSLAVKNRLSTKREALLTLEDEIQEIMEEELDEEYVNESIKQALQNHGVDDFTSHFE